MFFTRTRSKPSLKDRGISRNRSLMEPMEGRLLLAATALPPTANVAAVNATAKAGGSSTVDVLPLQITGLSFADFNKLITVEGTLAGSAFSFPIASLTATPNETGCPTLHVEFDPLQLSRNGFTVGTSPICVAITPEHDESDPVQDVLCDVADLIAQENASANVLEAIEFQGRLDEFETGLTAALNAAIGSATDSAVLTVSNSGNVGKNAVDTLTLTIAPFTTTADGAAIEVDNCANGPVVVTLTANSTETGKKVQNSLRTLQNVMNSNASATARANALETVARSIQSAL